MYSTEVEKLYALVFEHFENEDKAIAWMFEENEKFFKLRPIDLVWNQEGISQLTEFLEQHNPKIKEDMNASYEGSSDLDQTG